jgi:ATP-dependent RNA helicase DDX41
MITHSWDRVPPFLQTIDDPRAVQGGSLKGCPVCGGKVNSYCRKAARSTLRSGLGHGISNCPKLEDAQRRQMASHRATHGDEGGY